MGFGGCLGEKNIPKKYVRIAQTIYGTVIQVRGNIDLINKFAFNAELPVGSSLAHTSLD